MWGSLANEMPLRFILWEMVASGGADAEGGACAEVVHLFELGLRCW